MFYVTAPCICYLLLVMSLFRMIPWPGLLPSLLRRQLCARLPGSHGQLLVVDRRSWQGRPFLLQTVAALLVDTPLSALTSWVGLEQDPALQAELDTQGAGPKAKGKTGSTFKTAQQYKPTSRNRQHLE